MGHALSASSILWSWEETQLYSQESDVEGIDVDLTPEVGVQPSARASESQRTFSRRSSRYFTRSESYNESDSYDLRTKVRRRLHKYLFARPGNFSETEIDLVSDRQLCAEEILQEGWDVDELTEVLQQMPVTGREVWLDCLLLALEERYEDSESSIVEVLRTSGLKDASEKMLKGRLKGHTRDKLLKFYERLDKVLQILENKASTHYFQYLERESEQRQDLIEKQNEVLHDYVCELEHEFCELSGAISSYQTKKDMMLAKFSGVLDPEYSQLEQTSKHSWENRTVTLSSWSGLVSGVSKSKLGLGSCTEQTVAIQSPESTWQADSAGRLSTPIRLPALPFDGWCYFSEDSTGFCSMQQLHRCQQQILHQSLHRPQWQFWSVVKLPCQCISTICIRGPLRGSKTSLSIWRGSCGRTLRNVSNMFPKPNPTNWEKFATCLLVNTCSESSGWGICTKDEHEPFGGP